MNNNKNKKKIILIDLDGVLNVYRGNFHVAHIPEMKKGADIFLKTLSKIYEIKIFTTRPKFQAEDWIRKNKLDQYISAVTNKKEPAFLIIDDRCINFNGDYKNTLETIKHFTPWYK